MNILVTGAKGFIGTNTLLVLNRIPTNVVIGIDVESSLSELNNVLDTCDVLINLAGVNCPKKEIEFEQVNVNYLKKITDRLEQHGRRPLIIFSSSTQAVLDNPYGRSKKRAEEWLLNYSKREGAIVQIFRLPGVFGKWCMPNYNSVVATFCHNIARDLTIKISDPNKTIEIVHIDDVVTSFIKTINARKNLEGAQFVNIEPVYQISLGMLAYKLQKFRESRETLVLPDLSDPLDRKLFSTYISYLPKKGFDYKLDKKCDDRGALAELLKLNGHGQIFISRTRPGITRGNHYHDLKIEKFVVLEGDSIIRFRHMSTDEIIEYKVKGQDMRVLDIPPGWTHSIENIGISEMIVLFWASEIFDPKRPDTYSAEVIK